VHVLVCQLYINKTVSKKELEMVSFYINAKFSASVRSQL